MPIKCTHEQFVVSQVFFSSSCLLWFGVVFLMGQKWLLLLRCPVTERAFSAGHYG